MKNMKNRLLNILFNNNKDIFIKKFKNKKKTIMVAAIIVLGVVYSLGFGTLAYKYATVANNSYLDGSSKYDRISDNNTMESYKGQLIDEDPNGLGSRYAGRVWADKSVEANRPDGSFNLGLKEADDGLTTNVGLNTDFLHVFSTLGSSQKVSSQIPVDLVMVLDVSGSMGNAANDDSKISQSITAMNSAIDALMQQNPRNRVGVVLFASYPSVLMPLAHYDSKLSNNNSALVGNRSYINITRSRNFSQRPEAGGNPNSNENWWEYTFNAVTANGGVKTVYSGTDSNNNGVPDSDGGNGRGGTSFIGTNTNLDSGMWVGLNMLATASNTTTTVAGETLSHAPAFIVLGDGDPQYRTNYSNGRWWAPSNPENNFTLNTAVFGDQSTLLQTIMHASYMKSAVINNYRDKASEAKARNSETVDLGFYSIGISLGQTSHTTGVADATALLNPSEGFNNDSSSAYTRLAYQGWNNWKNSNSAVTVTGRNADNTIRLNQLSGSTLNHVTKDQVIENINYTDKFFNADTDGQINDTLLDLVQNVASDEFIPIAGSNDSGVSDSLTYMDPIGKYMEVKDKGVTLSDNNQYDLGLLLFGEMHGMVKTGIYDYNTNLKIAEKNGSFTMGWYDKDLNKKETGDWSKGDVYYLDGDTTRQYVSTLPDNMESAPEEQRNKVYTIYRFEKNITTGETEDTAARAVLHDNPCYNSGDVQYMLNEIRVWVEDSGNYTGGTGDSVIDNGYDSMIYVNIPSRALPVQVANVQLNSDGTVKDYSTNLDEKDQSTPFRLFYGVGVSDDIKTEDKLDIDLAKVSAEYIQSHTDEDGNVYFLSNYYSNTNYDGYVTDSNESRSRGDANFTFSPSTANRYYAFQRPLTLYELNDDEYEEDGQTVDYTKTKVFKTSTGANGFNNFESSHKKVESVSSDKAYWIVIDYYVEGNNETVRMAVKRRGSELGSYLGEDKTAEFLVWYNPETGDVQDFNNNVKPDDGYYVATKVGGLRTGDMAQNVHTKTPNRTGSAGTYYLPTASKNSEAGNIVMNGYLGNNGRLAVSDALLEITKEVEPAPAVGVDGTGEEKFNYRLSFQDADGNDAHEGDFQAIKTFKNPYSGKWQLRLSTIDLLTDERGLLQTEDNQLATDENGDYIYIGGNDDGDQVFHLYNANDNDIEGSSDPRAGRTVYVNSLDGLSDSEDGRVLYRLASKDHPAGSMEFWIKDYYLVTEEQLSTFDGTKTDGLKHVVSDEKQGIPPFVAADIDSNRQMKVTPSSSSTYAQPQKTQVYSKYATDTKYLTETLNFEDDGTGKYVAKFSLGHNEGLVINGLEKDYKYTVEEDLTEDQIQKGYRFDRAYGNTENDLLTPEERGTTRFGNTVSEENEVHYVNRSLNALSIVKTLKGLDANPNRDWHFTVELQRGTAESVGGEYYYIVTDTEDNKVIRTGNIEFTSEDSNIYTADFTIKGGEKMTIYGILDGTEYTITEREAGQYGYTTTVTGNNNVGTLNGDTEVEFVNDNPAEYDITLGKVVEGYAGDKTRDWNFDITLTAPEGEEIPTEYVCEGEACPADKITFIEQEDNTYKATVQLKHGEEITIKDLLEGTTYNIVEREANLDDYTTSHSGRESGTFGTDVTASQTVTFTNTKYSYHDLTVGKLVKGEDGDENAIWTFNIYLTPAPGITLDGSYEYEGGVIDGYEDTVEPAEDGTITFNPVTSSRGTYMGTVSVKHGQKVTIKGLPERTRYYVTEIHSNDNGYTALIPNNNGTFDSAGASGEVIITNVNLSEHDLIIEKQVEGTDGDTNRQWNFTVTLTPDKTTGVEFINSYETEKNGEKSDNIDFKETFEGSGVYVGHVSLKHGEQVRIKGLQEGTRYTVTEDEADQGEYFTKHTDNTEGVLENATDTQTVVFTNVRLLRQTLTLSKEVLGGAGEYEKPWEFVIKLSRDDDIELGKSESSVTYPCEGISKIAGVDAPDIDHVTFEKQEDGSYVARVELKHGQALTIKDIPENTKYEISETEANNGRYVTYTNDDTEGTITNDEGKGVTFYNKRPALIDLSLSKIVNGSRGETDRNFNFTVRFTPDEHVKFADEFEYTGTKSGSLHVSETSDDSGVYEGHITLKHNDNITIQGIPENTAYEVVEEDLSGEGYITRDSGNTTGTLLDKGTNVEFNNTNLGEFDLSVKKTLKGNRVEKNRDWTFEIVLTRPEIKDLNSSYKYTKNNDEDTLYDLELTKKDDGTYVGYITLKGGETATIKGLPETTRYIVNEVEANQDDYITKTDENAEGIIDRNGLLVEYTNWRFTRHKLTIEKCLKGDKVEKDREWTFEVTLKPKDDTPFDTVYPYVKNNGEEGKLDFTRDGINTYKAVVKLKGGEKITINGIPFETEYDVKEVEANQDNYETTDIDSKGTLTESEHKVIYINERNDLTKVKKVISGISGINNPNTRDEILKYFIMFIISIIGAFGVVMKEYVLKK